MIFHVMKDQGLIIHFVISRTFLDDRRIAINNYLFSRHSPSCFILWILLWQGIKFKRWEHFTYILKLYKLGEIVFFMKKAFVGFCHFVCLVQSFLLTFPQWKKYRMKWKWMYVCRMCNMFIFHVQDCYSIF